MIILRDNNNKIRQIINSTQANRSVKSNIIKNKLPNHISKKNSKYNQIVLIILIIKKFSFNINPIICPKRYRIRSNVYAFNLGESTIFWARK
jgi:hypothetical protein